AFDTKVPPSSFHRITRGAKRFRHSSGSSSNGPEMEVGLTERGLVGTRPCFRSTAVRCFEEGRLFARTPALFASSRLPSPTTSAGNPFARRGTRRLKRRGAPSAQGCLYFLCGVPGRCSQRNDDCCRDGTCPRAAFFSPSSRRGMQGVVILGRGLAVSGPCF